MYFAAALLVLVGCNKKENVIENGPEGTPFVKGQQVTLIVGTGVQGPNRVAGHDNASQIGFTWEEGDKILVGNDGSGYNEFTLVSEANAKQGAFAGEMPSSGTTFTVKYIGNPYLTEQTYSVAQIDAKQMSFEATNCVLDKTIILEPQYAMVQLNLYSTTEQKVGKIVFNDITCLFETVDDPFMATLNCTDEEGNGVTLSTNPEEPTPFYFIVPKGEYRFEVRVWNDDDTSPKKIAWFGTPAKQQFVSSEGKALCVNMPAREVKVEHTYVDLGTAGKWATINVGQDANGAFAVAPEDLGGAYEFDAAQTSFTDWGSNWKMPSAYTSAYSEYQNGDFNKLIAAENATCTRVTDYLGTGCAGLLFVGKGDYKDNYIFLPADHQGDNYWGEFWSSTVDPTSDDAMCELYFNCENLMVMHTDATDKYPVRLMYKDPYNGHEYVDLGLPSGIMWATCNVGATTPEEYGDYFAWGETAPYYNTPITNPINWKGGKTKGYVWQSYPGFTKLTEFTEWDLAPYDDNKILKPEYDAAHVNWEGNWRMPTKEEQKELINNCDWTWQENYNSTGVNGYLVTSKTNGNSIFLPASGYRSDSSLNNVGSYVTYWSSSRYENFPSGAYYLRRISGSDITVDYHHRFYGHTVRPVCE